MDGHVVERQDFQYVADPTFENFTDGVKKQVNKLIHAKVNLLGNYRFLHYVLDFSIITEDFFQ